MKGLGKCLSRAASYVLPAIVVVLTLGIVDRAWTSVVVPNEYTIGLTLGPGGNTAAITPAPNVPVHILGSQTTAGNVGSTDLTVVNSAGNDNYLVWNGLESNGGGVTAGFNTAAGTHIAYIDFIHAVDLQVLNTTSFKVHNGTSGSEHVVVTMIW